MFIEYSSFLRRLILEQYLETLPEVSSKDVLSIINELKLIPIAVEECPNGVTGVVASPVAFELPLMIRQILPRINLSPMTIASQLVELSRSALKSNGANYFKLSIGGPGYINGTPTEEFNALYLQTVILKDPRLLFCSKSFIVDEVKEEEIVIEEDLRKSIELNKVLGRLSMCNDEDIECFIKEQMLRDTSSDVLLMYLSLLGNKELETRSFELQLQESQNVPWFFKKCEKDTHTFGTLCIKRSGISRLEKVPFRITDFPGLEDLCEKICGFRFELVTAVKQRKPEIAVKAVLNIVRAFYSFYNRPQIRSVPIKEISNSPESRFFMGNVVKVVGFIVRNVRKQIVLDSLRKASKQTLPCVG